MGSEAPKEDGDREPTPPGARSRGPRRCAGRAMDASPHRGCATSPGVRDARPGARRGTQGSNGAVNGRQPLPAPWPASPSNGPRGAAGSAGRQYSPVTAASTTIGPRHAFRTEPTTSNNPPAERSRGLLRGQLPYRGQAEPQRATRTVDPAFDRNLAAGGIANGRCGFGLVGSRGVLRIGT
jgi:hypothetical protein